MSAASDDVSASPPPPSGRSEGGAGPEWLLRLGPTDLDACLALDAASLGGLWSAAHWLRELEEPHRPGVGLRRGDALLAMACGALVLDELHITLVAVDPGRRRQGLGRRVLQELLAVGRLLGAERATLEVSTDNVAAQGLYHRCGFRTAGRRRRYYRDGSDALIQWTTLDDDKPAMPSSAQVG